MNSTLQAVPKALYHETVLKKHRNNIALNTIATLFASLSDIEPCQVDGLRNSQVQTRREKKWASILFSLHLGEKVSPSIVIWSDCQDIASRFCHQQGLLKLSGALSILQ